MLKKVDDVVGGGWWSCAEVSLRGGVPFQSTHSINLAAVPITYLGKAAGQVFLEIIPGGGGFGSGIGAFPMGVPTPPPFTAPAPLPGIGMSGVGGTVYGGGVGGSIYGGGIGGSIMGSGAGGMTAPVVPMAVPFQSSLATAPMSPVVPMGSMINPPMNPGLIATPPALPINPMMTSGMVPTINASGIHTSAPRIDYATTTVAPALHTSGVQTSGIGGYQQNTVINTSGIGSSMGMVNPLSPMAGGIAASGAAVAALGGAVQQDLARSAGFAYGRVQLEKIDHAQSYDLFAILDDHHPNAVFRFMPHKFRNS